MVDATSANVKTAGPRVAACLPCGQGNALKRALKEMSSELLQSSFCKGDLPAEATAQAGMLYPQIQYVVAEDNWARHGEEVSK